MAAYLYQLGKVTFTGTFTTASTGGMSTTYAEAQQDQALSMLY